MPSSAKRWRQREPRDNRAIVVNLTFNYSPFANISQSSLVSAVVRGLSTLTTAGTPWFKRVVLQHFCGFIYGHCRPAQIWQICTVGVALTLSPSDGWQGEKKNPDNQPSNHQTTTRTTMNARTPQIAK
jgi:hypothetical protein